MSDEFEPYEEPAPDDAPAEDRPNAADPRSQERARRRAKEREDKRATFWRGVLADPIGRMVLWELFRDAGLFETRFAATPNGFPDPQATWFYGGRKDMAERLYRTLMRHDQQAIALIHAEHDPAWQQAKPARVTRRD